MKKLMAANWKMFKTREEAKQTAEELLGLIDGKQSEDREVLIFPPFTAIPEVAAAMQGKRGCSFGAQNFYPRESGAFTGEISPAMLKDAGCTWALAGHSERRWVFGEDDALVGEKVAYGLSQGLRMVLCIGEKIEERKDGKLEQVIASQLREGLKGVKEFVPGELAIAYEPVWAIGTGEVAGPEEILEAHACVRKELSEIIGNNAQETPILYGGSVKPDNASEIISIDNVDGVLVGGASLMAESFSRIVLA